MWKTYICDTKTKNSWGPPKLESEKHLLEKKIEKNPIDVSSFQYFEIPILCKYT